MAAQLALAGPAAVVVAARLAEARQKEPMQGDWPSTPAGEKYYRIVRTKKKRERNEMSSDHDDLVNPSAMRISQFAYHHGLARISDCERVDRIQWIQRVQGIDTSA